MEIPLYINSIPEVYMKITKKTTVLSIKEFLKKYNPEKIQLFVNDKTESKIFNSDKYDKYNLSSIWDEMTKPAIQITVKPEKKKVRFSDDVKNKTLNDDVNFKFTMDAAFFKYLLSVFGNYKTLMPLLFVGNSLQVFEPDSSFVSLMSANIPVDIDYEEMGKLDYGIEPIQMKKFIGTGIKNKDVTFIGKKDGYSLKLDQEEKTWINLGFDEEFLGLPDTDYVAELTVSSKDLHQIFKEKKKEQKSILLEVKDNKFYIDNKLFISSELKSSKNIKQNFNSKLLEWLSKTQNSQYAPKVTLYFAEDAPMKMSYFLSRKSKYQKNKKISSGYISYFLAPMFPEEDL